MSPKVSVIISTYNRPERLIKAVDSVLKQSFTDLEVIVVDDASKKDLEVEKKLSSIKDSRVKYFRLEKNSGKHAIPKNFGIKQSSGQFVAFLDDDNTYRVDHIAKLYKALEANDKIDVAYGDRWIHLPDGRETIGIYNSFNLGLLFTRNYIDTSDSLIKRSVLDYIGGWDERYKRFSDWNLYLRIAKAGFRMLHVPGLITDYYIHEGSISNEVENKENPLAPLWDPFDLEIRLPYLGPISQPRIGVFSITYDRLSYTKKAFSSLKKTAGIEYDHFVVDNGSTDGTQKWLMENFPEDRLILFNENRGISIASNRILDKMKDYDIIVKFDNDCMCLSDGWLKKMVEIWESNHLIALSCYVQGLKDHPGGAERLGFGLMKGELIGMTKHLGGICHFVWSKAYKGFRWPEGETLHGFQDLELSNYLLAHDYQMGYLENYFVNHGPVGTEEQKKDFPEYFERRKLEKITKYEGTN